jgi:hypothetical protein
MEIPSIVKERVLLFAEAFPLSAPVVPVVTGLLKSSASSSVQVPVVRDVALKLY